MIDTVGIASRFQIFLIKEIDKLSSEIHVVILCKKKLINKTHAKVNFQNYGKYVKHA